LLGEVRYRLSAISAMLCVALSGCAVTDAFDSLKRGGNPGPARAASTEPAAPTIDGAPGPTQYAAVPRPKPKPIGFSVTSRQFVNLDENGVLDLMGSPAMVREEPPAVIWSYLSGECRLDIYLYENVSTQALRSLTYVVETSRRDVAAEKHCLQQWN